MYISKLKLKKSLVFTNQLSGNFQGLLSGFDIVHDSDNRIFVCLNCLLFNVPFEHISLPLTKKDSKIKANMHDSYMAYEKG